MAWLLLQVCRLMLRVFFRQLEVVGHEHVPVHGKLMFALNHPNGLIDPLFILCHAGRPVSFLAKAPLFEMPVVGYFVRAFRCLPVYRQQDNNDPSQNRAMMQKAVELLAAGNALALFPEGTSHSDPRLKPFRSGAARIALSAATLSEDAVHVVPVGLYYSRKQIFRSNALLLFGEAVVVRACELDERSEPDREAVQSLTRTLSERVGELTLQAESSDLIYLAKIAERIIDAADRDEGLPVPESMAEKLERRRRLIDGHARLGRRAEVVALVARIRAYESSVKALELRVDQAFSYAPLAVASYLVRFCIVLGLVALPGLIGIVGHYPTYRLVGFIAFRYAKSELDIVATVKVVAGLLLFPLTWIAAGSSAGFLLNAWVGVAVALLMPLSALAALMLTEVIAGLLLRGKALWLALSRRGFVAHLIAERRAIRDQVLSLADAASAAPIVDVAPGQPG
jgi:1-acyl-sn-glycerol-3-phosphate acyltransferase